MESLPSPSSRSRKRSPRIFFPLLRHGVETVPGCWTGKSLFGRLDLSGGGGGGGGRILFFTLISELLFPGGERLSGGRKMARLEVERKLVC